MRFKLLSSILVSASMVTAMPAVAAPSSASKLSVVGARSGAPASGDSQFAQGSGAIIALALLAGIAAILIVGEVVNDNNSTSP